MTAILHHIHRWSMVLWIAMAIGAFFFLSAQTLFPPAWAETVGTLGAGLLLFAVIPWGVYFVARLVLAFLPPRP
jgi:hypothetical protein